MVQVRDVSVFALQVDETEKQGATPGTHVALKISICRCVCVASAPR